MYVSTPRIINSFSPKKLTIMTDRWWWQPWTISINSDWAMFPYNGRSSFSGLFVHCALAHLLGSSQVKPTQQFIWYQRLIVGEYCSNNTHQSLQASRTAWQQWQPGSRLISVITVINVIMTVTVWQQTDSDRLTWCWTERWLCCYCFLAAGLGLGRTD